MSDAATQKQNLSHASTRLRRRSPVAEVLTFARLHEWHPGKVSILLGFLMALHLAQSEVLAPAFVATRYAVFCLFLACAYMLNNASDVQQDQQAGKPVVLSDWSARKKLCLALTIGLFGLSLGLVSLPLKSCAVLLACYALAWCYSFPPRLKEHPVLGPPVATVGQLTLPGLVVWAETGTSSAVTLAYLAVMSLYGYRMIMVHQLLDLRNDRRTGIRTTARLLGRRRTRRLIWAGFFLELTALVVLLQALLQNGLPFWMLLALLVPLLRVGILLAAKMRIRLDAYEYIPLADIHESLLPLILAGLVAWTTGGTIWWLLPFLLAIFARRHYERLVPPFYLLRGA